MCFESAVSVWKCFQTRILSCLVSRLPPPASVPTDRSVESPPAPVSLAPNCQAPPRNSASSPPQTARGRAPLRAPTPSVHPSSEPAPPLHCVASTTKVPVSRASPTSTCLCSTGLLVRTKASAKDLRCTFCPHSSNVNIGASLTLKVNV